jgi:predicted dehydrogenase
MRVLRRLGAEARVVAAADNNPLALNEAEAEFELESTTGDWRELVADPSIDVIHVCTPNHLHAPITRAALNAGKHVFSEKPLAMSVEDGQALVDLAKEKERIVGVNFCYRYYPVIQEAAQRVGRGDLGRVTTVSGHYYQDHLLSPADYNWRLNPNLSGPSSMIADLGSHWFDLVETICGQRICAVMADTHTVYPSRMPGGASVKCPLEDIGAVLFRLEDGGIGTFITTQMAPGRKCAIDLHVYGTKSGLSWSHERANELWMGQQLAPNAVLTESPILQAESTQCYSLLPAGHPMGYHDAMYNLFREYYRAVNGGRGYYPSFEAGLAMLEVVEAAVESVHTRRWVQVGSTRSVGQQV